MNWKKVVPLVCMVVVVGITLSGCVEEEAAVNNPPAASFTYEVDNQTVSFTDTSTDPDDDTLTYTWTFGDGNTSTVENPEHTYAENNKTYTVTLTVADDENETDTMTETVTIGTPNQPPIASFTTEPEVNITANETVTFNATASNDTDGTIDNYTWDFGDNENGTGVVVNHTYSASNETVNYTVKLTVTDNDGATNTTEQIIEVLASEE